MKMSKSDMYILLVTGMRLLGYAKRKERKAAIEAIKTINVIGNKYDNKKIRKMRRYCSASVDQCRWDDLSEIATDIIFEYLRIHAEQNL